MSGIFAYDENDQTLAISLGQKNFIRFRLQRPLFFALGGRFVAVGCFAEKDNSGLAFLQALLEIGGLLVGKVAIGRIVFAPGKPGTVEVIFFVLRAFQNRSGELIKRDGKVRMYWIRKNGDNEFDLGGFAGEVLMFLVGGGNARFKAGFRKAEIVNLEKLFELLFKIAAARTVI